MKILLSAAATVMALTALAGCSDDDGGDTATDTSTDTSSDTSSDEPTTSEPTPEPTVGTYPEFEPEDYSFVLKQVCFCPIAGPVKVTVEDGEVKSAIVAKGGSGMEKGSDAPEYLWITINDVIAEANDTEAASVEVSWPDGQDWPASVAVDEVELATDDEITYVIRDVQVS
jgi:hypothetical protein